MPVIEFQRLPPDPDEEGEDASSNTSKGNFFAVTMHSSGVVENPNYNACLAKWLGVLQLVISALCVLDGIVTKSLRSCSIAAYSTPIWSGFPCFFLAGLLGVMSRDKRTLTIRLYMFCSLVAMAAAVTMLAFLLLSTVNDFHLGVLTYVGNVVAARLKLCFGFNIFAIILGFIEVFAAVTGIMVGSDRDRQPPANRQAGCHVMGDAL